MQHLFVRPNRPSYLGKPNQSLVFAFMDACKVYKGKPKWAGKGTVQRKDPDYMIAKCVELGYYLYDIDDATFDKSLMKGTINPWSMSGGV